MKDDISIIQNNINIIKNNKGIFEEKDYNYILKNLEIEYSNLNKLEFLNYTGEKYFNKNDIYLLNTISGFSFHGIYKILTQYDLSYETYYEVYTTNYITKLYLSNNTFKNPILNYEYEILPMINNDMKANINDVSIKITYISSLVKEFLHITENIMEVGEIYE